MQIYISVQACGVSNERPCSKELANGDYFEITMVTKILVTKNLLTWICFRTAMWGVK